MKWKFTNVHHSFRLKAGLSFNEYGVLDVIYQGQSNPSTSEHGWSKTPYKEIGDFLGLSVGAVKGILDRMEAIGLLELTDNKRMKRTTALWYENAYIDNDRDVEDAAKTILANKKVQKLNVQKLNKKVQKLNGNRSETELSTLVYKEYNKDSNNVGQSPFPPFPTTEDFEKNDADPFTPDAISDYEEQEGQPAIVHIGQKEKKKKVAPKKKKDFSGEVWEVVEYLNAATGRDFRPDTKETARFIVARLKQHDIQDLKDVIDLKTSEWLNDSKMSEYLRPSTLFNESKFETYHLKVKSIQNGTYPKQRNNGTATEIFTDQQLRDAYAQLQSEGYC